MTPTIRPRAMLRVAALAAVLTTSYVAFAHAQGFGGNDLATTGLAIANYAVIAIQAFAALFVIAAAFMFGRGHHWMGSIGILVAIAAAVRAPTIAQAIFGF